MQGLIKKKSDLLRTKTHIKGLDDNIEGGIPAGHVVLVAGTAGTMKSSICFNILYQETFAGKIGLFFSIEQDHISLLNHFIGMGYDFSKIEVIVLNANFVDIGPKLESLKNAGKGALLIADIGDIRKETELLKNTSAKSIYAFMRSMIASIRSHAKLDLVVIDSLDAIYSLANLDVPRKYLFQLFEYLRDLGTTSFVISEMPLDGTKFSYYGVEDYLADGLIMLRLVERYRKVTREIAVVKMRGTDCNLDIFTLKYDRMKFFAEHGGQLPSV